MFFIPSCVCTRLLRLLGWAVLDCSVLDDNGGVALGGGIPHKVGQVWLGESRLHHGPQALHNVASLHRKLALESNSRLLLLLVLLLLPARTGGPRVGQQFPTDPLQLGSATTIRTQIVCPCSFAALLVVVHHHQAGGTSGGHDWQSRHEVAHFLAVLGTHLETGLFPGPVQQTSRCGLLHVLEWAESRVVLGVIGKASHGFPRFGRVGRSQQLGRFRPRPISDPLGNKRTCTHHHQERTSVR